MVTRLRAACRPLHSALLVPFLAGSFVAFGLLSASPAVADGRSHANQPNHASLFDLLDGVRVQPLRHAPPTDNSASALTPGEIPPIEEPPPPPVFAAQYRVMQMIGVNPLGQPQWFPVSLDDPSLTVPLGQRLMFDGSVSTGQISSFRWEFVPGFYERDPVEYYSFDTPGPHSITLKIYNSAFQSRTVTHTVYVREGMSHLSTTPYPGVNYYAKFVAVDGTRVWAISDAELLATTDVSNPSALPALQLMTGRNVSGAWGLAAGSGGVFVPRGSAGVDIYCSNPSQCTLLSTLTSAQLGGGALGVAYADGHIYVCTDQARVQVYNVQNPGSPAFVASLSIPAGPARVATLGGCTLLVVDLANQLHMFDIDDPAYGIDALDSLALTPPVSRVTAHERFAGLNEGFALMQIRLDQTPETGGTPTISVRDGLVGAEYFAMTNRELFAVSGGWIKKYDITEGLASEGGYYELERFNTGDNFLGPMFLLDPDGPTGPQPQLLYYATFPCGFGVMRP